MAESVTQVNSATENTTDPPVAPLAPAARWPARLDLLQSGSGLLLGLFMWVHMMFVASILLGKDAMWTVARSFEGYYLFGRSLPWLVSLLVGGVFALVIVHAALALRAAGCQSPTPVRRVLGVAVRRDADRVEIRITANAFLHHMVRNVAGALIEVGVGDRAVDWVAELLASRDRTQGGVTAPPQGLYFAGVAYDARWGLPTEAAGLR